MKRIAEVAMISLLLPSMANTQQIPVTRIELMPSIPAPYEMRNWRQVALGYDSLVFDFGRTGQYLPLIWWELNTVNYPSQKSFGLKTVVGDTRENHAEAINVLPAVIGASLAGIDKSNQHGENWVLMCQEFFNRRPEENVYLNGPQASSGDDWWYETMPNVFFYQLYAMYPNTGDFQYQFGTVADRWLQAVAAMGGSATPWHIAVLHHRAWSLSTMTPNDDSPHEPEAAGAIAWILYNAYRVTGDMRYRMGAEWCMEFLNSLTTNPAYELQLPYGVLTAARMNAELGTTYDIPKMMNWCFDVGPLRNWGAIVGTWGGYDVHGLIGEVNYGNDYAFLMNTFEQVGALVPLVRYDARFARAIGKWVLNAANAARLFSPNYLPDSQQDSREWSRQYDPQSFIAHEALRQKSSGPFGTGDAISGGWGNTTLTLYSSSHVGIFGGIIDTTNVEMILQLDLLKTDYFHADAYPSFLYYNPTTEAKSVEIDVGSGTHDLYDAVTRTFLRTAVTGKTSFVIPADMPAVVVVVPSGGALRYEGEKMLVNDRVVDYHSGNIVSNAPPRIKGLAASPASVVLGTQSRLYCTATDNDSDTLAYRWSATSGTIAGSGATVTWTAPSQPGSSTVVCEVDDGQGGLDSAAVTISVIDVPVSIPVISRILARPGKIDLGATSTLTCIASDTAGYPLTYRWTPRAGSITGGGSSVTWSAPAVKGDYVVVCDVDNGQGGRAVDSVAIEVRDFSETQTGSLVAFYPFNGNANDESGLGNNGVATGAVLVPDRNGTPASAYSFDGVNDAIRVPNSPSLNFQTAATINFWMKIASSYPFTKEAFPVSHGSWENRWKVSITPERRIRWTVKSTAGTKDLDTRTTLSRDTLYNVTALYSGSDYELYLNGQLDAFASFSGSILTTTIDLTIGQILPSNNNYNFQGILDDIRIYDYALSVSEIEKLAGLSTSVDDPQSVVRVDDYSLDQNYPNPFNPSTTITFSLRHPGFATVKVYDLFGREVAVLVSATMTAGRHAVTWTPTDAASGVYYYTYRTGNYSSTRAMLLIR